MCFSVCIYNTVEALIWIDTVDDTTSLFFLFQKHIVLIVFVGVMFNSVSWPFFFLPSKCSTLLNMLIRLFILTSWSLCLQLISGAS